MMRFILFASGFVSLIYFLNPSIFPSAQVDTSDILGVSQINANINKSTIETALLMYCLSDGGIPEELSELYGGYLEERRKLDLDKIYSYKIVSKDNCEYDLSAGD